MSNDYCGSTNTTTGKPCRRPAGWGTDSDEGFCREHQDDQLHPRKLSYELQERLASDLEDGIPVKYAAPANGISPDTYHRWVREGRPQDEGPLSDFSERVTRARATGKASILRDAVTIAREEGDSRALLNALAEIEGGETDVDEDTGGVMLVVPESARREEEDH